jgi:hypothetical protein
LRGSVFLFYSKTRSRVALWFYDISFLSGKTTTD